MKRIYPFFLSFNLVFATIFSFSPPNAKGKVGEKKTFQLQASYQHLPCLVGIQTVEITYENLKPVSVSEWESIAVGKFRKIITVKLTKEGKGKIKASHICPIKESKGEAMIDIGKRTFEEAYREARELLTDLFLGGNINFEDLKSTLEELLTDYPPPKDKKNFLEKAKLILEEIKKIQTLATQAVEEK